MKRTLLFVLAVVVIYAGTASAQDVKLDVKCPPNIRAGSLLNVTLNVSASTLECTGTIGVPRLMVAIGGNAQDTLGGIGIWGPFLRPANWTLTFCAAPLTKTVKVIDAMPATVVGTMAMVMVKAIDSAGRELGSGTCYVNVLPAL